MNFFHDDSSAEEFGVTFWKLKTKHCVHFLFTKVVKYLLTELKSDHFLSLLANIVLIIIPHHKNWIWSYMESIWGICHRGKVLDEFALLGHTGQRLIIREPP